VQAFLESAATAAHVRSEVQLNPTAHSDVLVHLVPAARVNPAVHFLVSALQNCPGIHGMVVQSWPLVAAMAQLGLAKSEVLQYMLFWQMAMSLHFAPAPTTVGAMQTEERVPLLKDTWQVDPSPHLACEQSAPVPKKLMQFPVVPVAEIVALQYCPLLHEVEVYLFAAASKLEPQAALAAAHLLS